jgi:hypothetical protein
MLADRILRYRRRRRDRDLAERQTATAPLAEENAREFCAVAGPWMVAADYGAGPEASLPEIAECFARASYHNEPSVQEAAKAGALAGFEQYLAAHPEDPYD